MASRKVLHLTYDMRIGGTEMVIKNLVEGEALAKFDIGILCIEPKLGPFGELLKKQGVSVENLFWQGGFDLKLIKAIRAKIKRDQIDILHCHQYTPWVYGVLAAAFTKTKVIFTEHGRFYPDSSSWKRRFINPLLLAITNKVTSISKATKVALTEYEFVPAKRIEVIYNGIKGLIHDAQLSADVRQKLGITEQNVLFGTVARLDPIKNQTMMIQAFAKVLERHSHCRLVIVGDGEERDKLEQLVDELAIRDEVIFTGYITEPVNYISAMDAFLLSSLSEGTSMTLLESLSLGKPCIVTDAGGNAEVVEHDMVGWVSPNNDMMAFSANMNKFVEQSEVHRQQFSRQCKIRFSELFEDSVMQSKFVDLYEQLD